MGLKIYARFVRERPSSSEASAACLDGLGVKRAGLRAAPPRGFVKLPGAPPHQATPFPSRCLYPSPFSALRPLSASLLAGVRPGLGASNRSLRSPPAPRLAASRTRRCPGCTCAQPGHRRSARGLLAASSESPLASRRGRSLFWFLFPCIVPV